jgi:hypothetical protein
MTCLPHDKSGLNNPTRDALDWPSPCSNEDQQGAHFVFLDFPDAAVVMHRRIQLIVPVDIRVTSEPSEGMEHDPWSLRKTGQQGGHQDVAE